MASRRQKKKQQKRLLQMQVKANKQILNISEKEVQRASFNTLKTLTEKAEKVQKERYRKRRADSRKNTRLKKQKYLESLGVDVWKLRVKDIDSIKIKDIENRRVNSENYPDIFKGFFDYDKLYILPENQHFFFAYRDFAGERSLEEILSDYENLSIEQLLNRLESIVNLPASYQKGISGSSSGSAGDYKFQCADRKTIQMFNRETYNQNRRKTKRKKHQGQYKGFQVLKSGRNISIDKVTPRRLLIVANAIMHNVTEIDRKTFYQNFYTAVSKTMPDFAKQIPKP